MDQFFIFISLITSSVWFVITLVLIFGFFALFVFIPNIQKVKELEENVVCTLNEIYTKIFEPQSNNEYKTTELLSQIEILRNTFIETREVILENLDSLGSDEKVIDKLKDTIRSFDVTFESTCSHIQSSINNQHSLLFHVEHIKADLDILIRTRIVMLKFFEKLVKLAVANELQELDMEECIEMRNVLSQYINESYVSDYKTAPLPALLGGQTNKKSNNFSKAFQHEDNAELSGESHDELIARIVNLERKLSLK